LESIKKNFKLKKAPAKAGAKFIEAGFIQARNLSSSKFFIQLITPDSKQKVCKSVI
tara:strand:- start:1045 stop:1212 length:168 start_codon:yes stop_codon:yes gene_type:complete